MVGRAGGVASPCLKLPRSCTPGSCAAICFAPAKGGAPWPPASCAAACAGWVPHRSAAMRLWVADPGMRSPSGCCDSDRVSSPCGLSPFRLPLLVSAAAAALGEIRSPSGCCESGRCPPLYRWPPPLGLLRACGSLAGGAPAQAPGVLAARAASGRCESGRHEMSAPASPTHCGKLTAVELDCVHHAATQLQALLTIFA